MDLRILALAMRDTLLDQGRVDLPGLGSLTLVYHPARLDRLKARIYPPEKKPVFEGQSEGSNQADAVFEAAWARAAGLSVREVGAGLTAALDQLATRVRDGEEIRLPEVGVFTLEQPGQPRFEPDSFNYHLEVFGLEAVDAIPLARRSAAEAAAEALAAREPVHVRLPHPTGPKSGRWRLPMTAVLVLLAFSVALWLVFSPNSTAPEPDIADVSPFEEEEVPPSFSEEEALDRPDIFDVEDDEEEEAFEREATPPPPPALTESPAPAPAAGAQYIVVGHFGDQENARRMLERIGALGLEGQASPRGQLTRVVVVVRPGQHDPDVVLTTVRQSLEPAAWLIK